MPFSSVAHTKTFAIDMDKCKIKATYKTNLQDQYVWPAPIVITLNFNRMERSLFRLSDEDVIIFFLWIMDNSSTKCLYICFVGKCVSDQLANAQANKYMSYTTLLWIV